MADEEQGAEGEKKAPDRKKMLLKGIVGFILLVGVGAGSAFFLMAPSEDTAVDAATEATGETPASAKTTATEEDHATAADSDSSPPQEPSADSPKNPGGEDAEGAATKTHQFGDTLVLKPFHLNLGNPLENRYIRLEVALEYKGGEAQKSVLERRTPQLRDVIISTASRKTREFLLGPDGKDQLRLEILNRVNQYLDRKIESVYITDMIIE